MRVAIVGLASLVAVLAHAQPAGPDLDRARSEYATAEKAMAGQQYNDATNHYANAYRASKDPALLYKIGVARQKAGDCLNAVRLFAIYLKVGKPADDFVAITRDRITQCAGDPDADPGTVPADPVAGWGTGSVVTPPGPGSGSAEVQPGTGSGSGSATPPAPLPDPGAGSTASKEPPAPAKLVPRHRTAWMLVGGAIAFATAGAVLAYSANASERDLEDLYVGLGGNPPTFNAQTKATFDNLVEEGERYQRLSWLSFGVAAILGGVAAYRFVTDEKPRVQVTPTASPTGAGVSATVRF
jgi:hypothetical protein